MPDSTNQSAPAPPARVMSLPEFVALTAMLMAANALAVDIMLPALPGIGAEFGLAEENDRQLVVVSYMMGFGVSQLVFGPLTDRFGRRWITLAALGCYSIAGVACVFAPGFEAMIAARVFQGACAGGVRVVAVSAARDLYSGRRMAKVMSWAIMVFMAAPIFAPSIGQALLTVMDWRGLFWLLAAFGLLLVVWVVLRMPETHPPERRSSLDPATIAGNYLKVLRIRTALGYTIASGLLFSALLSFISASEQLYHQAYDTGTAFTLYFAGAAGAMTVSNLLNSWVVERVGMRRLSHAALIGFVVVSGVHALLALQGPVPFQVFYGLLLAAFFTIGFQGPNYNAIAMEPLGRLAGSGAAVIGFASSFLAALLGGFIARQFDGSTAPIFLGHFIVSACALGAVLWTERWRLFQVGEAG